MNNDSAYIRRVKRAGISQRKRFEILKRDNFRCVYCGSSPGEKGLHVDHVLAVSKSGTNDDANLVTACADCNGGKSNISLDIVNARPSFIEGSEPLEISCDECGDDLVPGFDEDADNLRHRGWVMWFSLKGSEQPNGKRMAHNLRIRCTSCHRDMHNDDEQIPGHTLLDWPLEWVTGARAMARLYHLLDLYEWESDERKRVFDCLFPLQFLPTWEGHTPSEGM